jgi:hypothetical protein
MAQEIHQLCRIFRRQGQPVRIDAEVGKSSESPLERRRYPSNVAPLEGQLTNGFEFGSRVGVRQHGCANAIYGSMCPVKSPNRALLLLDGVR